MIEHEIDRKTFQEAIEEGVKRLEWYYSGAQEKIEETILGLRLVGQLADKALVRLTRAGECGCPMAQIGQQKSHDLGIFALSFDRYICRALGVIPGTPAHKEGFRVLIKD